MATAELLDLDGLLDDTISPSKNEKEESKKPVGAENNEALMRRRSSCPANVLFFDLETIPDYGREQLFGLPPVPQPAMYAAESECPMPTELIRGTEDDVKAAISKAQSNGKMLPKSILEAALSAESKSEKPKPRKGVMSILADMIKAIDGEASAIEQAANNRRKEMSVTPEFCRIVSFGWAMGDDIPQSSTFRNGNGTEDHDTYEKSVLKKFWEQAKRAKLIVGFNHVGFDLPVIYVRSALLGIEPTRTIDLKPWGGEVCDIMSGRWPRGGQKKLKDLARIVGFPVPAGDVDGSQVEELLKTDPMKLADYNRSDVSITREIFLMYRGLFW